MSEQLKQELEADTDRLEAETVADSETIGEQEEKPTEGKLEDQKGDESKEEIEAAEAENAKPVKQKATGLYTKRKAQQIICGDDTKIPKCDGVITRTGATVGILHQKRFIREMLSCTTRICQIH